MHAARQLRPSPPVRTAPSRMQCAAHTRRQCSNPLQQRTQVVGGKRCPIIDTWWQTETGAHMITPLPGATLLKPGSATLPFFGVEPAILDAESGRELTGEAEGCVRASVCVRGASGFVDAPHPRRMAAAMRADARVACG